MLLTYLSCKSQASSCLPYSLFLLGFAIAPKTNFADLFMQAHSNVVYHTLATACYGAYHIVNCTAPYITYSIAYWLWLCLCACYSHGYGSLCLFVCLFFCLLASFLRCMVSKTPNYRFSILVSGASISVSCFQNMQCAVQYIG